MSVLERFKAHFGGVEGRALRDHPYLFGINGWDLSNVSNRTAKEPGTDPEMVVAATSDESETPSVPQADGPGWSWIQCCCGDDDAR